MSPCDERYDNPGHGRHHQPDVGASSEVRRVSGSKQFFFEKKNQKTFVYKAFAYPQRLHHIARSSCFFFQKETLSGIRLE
jgi:hypothetical protein